MTNQIVLSGIETPRVQMSEEALNESVVALLQCRAVTAVASAEDQHGAAACLSAINALIRRLEASRTEVKKPILEAGRMLDLVANQYRAPLEIEAKRIAGLLKGFDQAERARLQKIIDDAERARKEAAEKLAQEQRELQARLDKARTAPTKERIQAEIATRQQEFVHTVVAAQKVIAQAPAAPAKIAGLRTARGWKHEVTDIKALHAAHPDCVSWVANDAVIRAMIKGGMRESPGLRIFEDVSFS